MKTPPETVKKNGTGERHLLLKSTGVRERNGTCCYLVLSGNKLIRREYWMVG